uniref:RNA-directed DNA polymerase n=1 Tax=Tanacetum cinerariifolium TaxID=118510 RepID=A0A6L2JXA9_TANCI|nr:putative reverse transcriptase domain-containing protein [Tanacetum cinerariifolium]
MPITRTRASRTREGVNEQINHRLAGALGAHDVARNLKPLIGGGGEQEEVNGSGGNGNRGNGNEVNGNSALTWWNSHNITNRIEAASTMSWVELMKLMTEELVLLCTRMVPNEEDKVKRFVGGLPNNILGNVIAVEPTKLQDAIRIANNLMDQKLKGYAGIVENKRRLENNPRPYTVRCGNCKRFSHMTRDCADRSFVSSTFSALLDVAPSTLNTSYAIELVDERILETNVVLRGCTLGLLGHPFNIDLMPVELGSFDIIIGMDLLANYHELIVCDEKVVCIRYEDEVLIIQGDDCDGENRFVIVFIDDILIYSKSIKEHEGHLKLILSEGIHVDLAKIESIKDWASPKTSTRIRQFLGLVGYYRRFIKGFSKIARPIMKLNQKSVKFDWGEKAEVAFHLLKQKLCSAPILALPEGSENFVVYCDASHKGLGAVLMEKEKVIAYRHYMYGTKCIVFTDHKSLQHILDQKELNIRQRRWLELLSDYNCEIQYHPGKENMVSDALIRKERSKSLRVRA